LVESNDSDKTIEFNRQPYPATATLPEWFDTPSDEDSEENNIGEVNGKVDLLSHNSTIEKVSVDEVALVVSIQCLYTHNQ
jgi:hypothetical protein